MSTSSQRRFVQKKPIGRFCKSEVFIAFRIFLTAPKSFKVAKRTVFHCAAVCQKREL